MERSEAASGPRPALGLIDSASIIVGVIIGVGIFEAVPGIAANVSGSTQLYAVWILGAVFSICGAFCYAELAANYPEEGGDYAYLTKAFGPLPGFLFAWARLVIVQPGSIAAMAFPFARYALEAIGVAPEGAYSSRYIALVAASAVAVITMLNMAAVRTGTRTQNFLTAAKVLGLLFIVGCAVYHAAGAPVSSLGALPGNSSAPGDFGLALILVLFCYGGWSDLSFVAAEIKDPTRTVYRALLLGLGLTAGVYLMVNAAFISLLGFPAVQSSSAIATDALRQVLPESGPRLISLLICASSLGAINAMVFTGARVSYAMGREHRLFSALSSWNERTHTPLYALTAQGVLAIALILAAGSFSQVLVYTTTVVWAFYTLTGAAVIALRRQNPRRSPKCPVPLYPYIVLIFCASCLYVTYSAVRYDPIGTSIALVITLAGIPIWYFSRR